MKMLTTVVVLAVGALGTAACADPDGRKAPRGSTSAAEDSGVVVAIQPTSGLSSGGTILTLTGAPYSSATTVMMGTQECPIVESSGTTILCTVPPATGVATVAVEVSGIDAGRFTYVGDPVAWYDAALASRSDGDVVVAWSDRSQQRNHLTVTHPPNFPTWLPDAINGHPAIHFENGANSNPDVSLSRSDAIGLPQGAAARSLFAVASFDDPLRNGTVLGYGSPDVYAVNQRFGIYRYAGAPGGPSISVEIGQGDLRSPMSVTARQAYVFGCTYEEGSPLASNVFTINHVPVAALPFAAAVGVAPATNGAFIGVGNLPGGNQFDGHLGDVAEILLYARALSAAERDIIEGYLLGKYGL